MWNAGDLEQWVHEQAVQQGCTAGSVQLDDWYSATDNGNVWHGHCVDGITDAQRSLAINVDRVWTPSSAQ